MNEKIGLKYLIDNEHFLTCQFLSTGRFISYCQDRGINTSEKQLEQLEKIGIFYPIARVQYPTMKIKVEYVENGKRYKDLGVLKKGEEWSGDTKEQYSDFWFEKELAKNWFENSILWSPRSKDFQPWSTFKDEDMHIRIESYYSIFQCYVLYNLLRSSKFTFGAEWWFTYDREAIDKITAQISESAEVIISTCRKNGIRGKDAVSICQIISNRYFPKTQTDQRSISISMPSHSHDWNWYEYCRNWDAEKVFNDLEIDFAKLKDIHQLVTIDAKNVDPLERWYGLVSFISTEQKRKLKGNALLAQTLYSMEHMLRLFYEELTGGKLFPPDESPLFNKESFYGEGISDNKLKYLELLANQYHLNPRPILILVVEGNGEFEQFPKISEKLLGYDFSTVGIEIVNLQGIGGFTGKKAIDKFGALEKFIDYYHYRQTIVFVVLDDEGRASKVKENLIKAPSKFYPKRTVTKDEYIYLWNRNVEFDNFSHDEIASAMTMLCDEKYTFKAEEIAICESSYDTNESDSLSKLYKEKLNYDLPKTKLLEKLIEPIYIAPENEFENKKAKRPLVNLIYEIVQLAAKNHQPVTHGTWEKNQESGYFGSIIEE